MKRLLALVLLAASGCVSDKAFVADSAAERIYREDKYERECVEKAGPPSCQIVQENLNLLEHHEGGIPKGLIPVANEVQKLGTLPADEKKEIREALKKTRL